MVKQLDPDDTWEEGLKKLIKLNCNQINHLVAGINSPFLYSQIQAVQEDLRDILETVGIKNG